MLTYVNATCISTTVAASTTFSSFLYKGNECEYELGENGNEREAGASGREKNKKRGLSFSPLPIFPRAPPTARYRFERATGDEAATVVLSRG